MAREDFLKELDKTAEGIEVPKDKVTLETVNVPVLREDVAEYVYRYAKDIPAEQEDKYSHLKKDKETFIKKLKQNPEDTKELLKGWGIPDKVPLKNANTGETEMYDTAENLFDSKEEKIETDNQYKNYMNSYTVKFQLGNTEYTRTVSKEEAEDYEEKFARPTLDGVNNKYETIKQAEGEGKLDFIRLDFWDSMGAGFAAIQVGAEVYYDELVKGYVDKETATNIRELKEWEMAYDKRNKERGWFRRTIGKGAKSAAEVAPILPATFLGGPVAMTVGAVSGNLKRASSVTDFTAKNVGKIATSTSIGAMNMILLNPFKNVNMLKAIGADYAIDQGLNAFQSLVETGELPSLSSMGQSAWVNTLFLGGQLARSYKATKFVQAKNAMGLKQGDSVKTLFELNNRVISDNSVSYKQKADTVKSFLDTDAPVKVKNMLIENYNERVSDVFSKIDTIEEGKTRIQQEVEKVAGITVEDVQKQMSEKTTDVTTRIKNEELTENINYKTMLRKNYPGILYGSKYNEADKVKLIFDLNDDNNANFKLNNDEYNFLKNEYLSDIAEGKYVEAKEKVKDNIDNIVVRDIILNNEVNANYLQGVFYRQKESYIPNRIQNIKQKDFNRTNNENLADVYLNAEPKKISLENHFSRINNKQQKSSNDIVQLKNIAEEFYNRYVVKNDTNNKRINTIRNTEDAEVIKNNVDKMIGEIDNTLNKLNTEKLKYKISNTDIDDVMLVGKGYKKFKNTFDSKKPLDLKPIYENMIKKDINAPFAVEISKLDGRKFSDLNYYEKQTLYNTINFLKTTQEATLDAIGAKNAKEIAVKRNKIRKIAKDQRGSLTHKIGVGLRNIPLLGSAMYKMSFLPDVVYKIIDGGDGPLSKLNEQTWFKYDEGAGIKKSLYEFTENNWKNTHYKTFWGDLPDTKVNIQFEGMDKPKKVLLSELAALYTSYKSTDGTKYLLGETKDGEKIDVSEEDIGFRFRSEKNAEVRRTITKNDIKQIEGILDEYGLKNIDEEFFALSNEAMPYIREGLLGIGQTIGEVPKYIHFTHSKTDIDTKVNKRLNDIQKDASFRDLARDFVNRKSQTKERTEISPLVIEPIWYKAQKMIEDAADINTKTRLSYIFKNIMDKKTKQELEKTFGKNILGEIAGSGKNNPSMNRFEKNVVSSHFLDQAWNKYLGRFVRSILPFKIGVPPKQVASVLMAYNEGLDMKYIMNGLNRVSNNKGLTPDQVQNLIPSTWERFQRGKVNKAIGTATEMIGVKDDTSTAKKVVSKIKRGSDEFTKKGMQGIVEGDKLAITSLVNAVSEKILAENDFTFGSKEWSTMLREESIKYIFKSQPVWYAGARTELAASKKPLANLVTMFHTATTQNINNIYRNFLDYTNGGYKTLEGNKKFAKQISNYLLNKTIISGIDIATGKVTRLRDKNFLEELEKNLSGDIPLTGELYQLIKSASKGKYYSANLPYLRVPKDVYDVIKIGTDNITGATAGGEPILEGSVEDVTNYLFFTDDYKTKTKNWWKFSDKFLSTISKTAGIPYSGSKQIGNMIRLLLDEQYRRDIKIREEVQKQREKQRDLKRETMRDLF